MKMTTSPILAGKIGYGLIFLFLGVLLLYIFFGWYGIFSALILFIIFLLIMEYIGKDELKKR
jgi:hypothetical protein